MADNTKNSAEWYKKEKIKNHSKEITIKLNTTHLKTAGYVLIVLILVGIITAQYHGLIPAKNSIVGSATAMIDPIEEENKTSAVTIIKPDGSVIDGTATADVEEEIEEEKVEEEEEELLPITGEMDLIINKINYVIKGDDYARVMSVEFTIINQDVDFVPKIVGYLTAYGSDDEKTVTLAELKAGESRKETSTKLTFGYNNIDDEQILKLELYKGSKLEKTVSKSFETN
ncbi:hypothetical protein GOV06_05770 [Candidatus Woesearchaeota archaeon]|nr:hypothetical protein [Candidatus Woesearchaeota archaeon]